MMVVNWELEYLSAIGVKFVDINSPTLPGPLQMDTETSISHCPTDFSCSPYRNNECRNDLDLSRESVYMW